MHLIVTGFIMIAQKPVINNVENGIGLLVSNGDNVSVTKTVQVNACRYSR